MTFCVFFFIDLALNGNLLAAPLSNSKATTRNKKASIPSSYERKKNNLKIMNAKRFFISGERVTNVGVDNRDKVITDVRVGTIRKKALRRQGCER